jgi:hypothetical protein
VNNIKKANVSEDPEIPLFSVAETHCTTIGLFCLGKNTDTTSISSLTDADGVEVSSQVRLSHHLHTGVQNVSFGHYGYHYLWNIFSWKFHDLWNFYGNCWRG